MAGTIKGIVVEIGGDTTKLGQALSNVNKDIKDTQSSLRQVEKLLKLDPTNTELLAQKQKLLSQAIEQSKTKVDALKQAQEQAKSTLPYYDQWKEKYEPIKSEIDATKTKMAELKDKMSALEESGQIDTAEYQELQAQLNEASDACKNLQEQAKAVDEEFGKPLSQDQYDELTRDVISAEQALGQLESAQGALASSASSTAGPLQTLTSTINTQESEVAELKKKYMDAALAYGEDSEQAQNLKSQISTLSGELNTNKEKLNAVQTAADKMGDEVEDSAEQAEEAGDGGWTAFGQVVANLATQLIQQAIDKIIEFGKSVVDTGLDFSTANSQLAATMGTTTDQITELTEFAQKMGATTAYTATEAAEGLNILAMSGMDAEQQMALLPNVMNLAQAGAISLDTAAGYLTGTIKGYGDTADNAQYYTDLIAKGATMANTDVNDLGAALADSAATASAYGQSAESVTLSLLKLAEQGDTGTSAATSLNRAMADLYTPTDAAKTALEALGVSAYNADGSAKDFNDVVAELQGALSGMSDEEANAYKNTIFTTNGLNAYNKMCATSTKKEKEFEKGLSEASDAMDGSGSAAEQAATQMDNLQGDLTLMDSATDGVKLQLFALIEGPLRQIVNAITNEVIPAISSVITWMTEHKGIMEVVGGVVATLTTAILAFNVSLHATAIVAGIATAASSAFGAVMAFLTSPVTLVVAAIAALIAIITLCVQHWDEIKAAVQSFIDTALPIVEAGFNAMKEWISTTMETIKKVVSEKWDQVKNWISTTMENITSTISQKWNEIKTWISTTMANIKSNLTNVWNAITSWLATTMQSVKDNLVSKWTEIKTSVTTTVENVRSMISEKWSAIKSFISSTMDSIKNTISSIWNTISSTVSTVLSTISSKISSVWNSISSTVSSVMNSIRNTFSSVWNSISSTISGSLNTIKSTISSGLNSAWSTVTNTLDSIKNKFSSIFDTCKNVVTSAINTIRNAFNFSWSLPSLKLPHIGISGSFSLNPPSVPHFSISWYKKAMENAFVLDGATMFGAMNGNALVGGESGREVISGEAHLIDLISSATGSAAVVSAINELRSNLGDYLPKIAENKGVYMDGDTLVGSTAVRMKNETDRIARMGAW